ncbi:MAG: GNAT family N-acetyltransferase [Lewinella sp.]|nr:GNAT family N-acetyltransferase [Lewinella sp.]
MAHSSPTPDFDHIHIRQAVASDLPDIHALVGELAAYEKAPEAFVATLADYQRDFADGVFEATVATQSGNVIGLALYYLTYSTWKGRMLYLEDFVVREAYRRHGVGARLFDAFLARARELDCRLVKWQVLDWNEPALNFYRKYQAIIEKEWWNGKLFLSENPQ